MSHTENISVRFMAENASHSVWSSSWQLSTEDVLTKLFESFLHVMGKTSKTVLPLVLTENVRMQKSAGEQLCQRQTAKFCIKTFV